MAVDRAGRTIEAGDVYMLAGVVVAIQGTRILVRTGSGQIMHVEAGEIVTVDNAKGGHTHEIEQVNTLDATLTAMNQGIASKQQASPNLTALSGVSGAGLIERDSGGGMAVRAIGDATAGAKGLVQLAGDLAGTAAAPEIGAGKVTNAKLANAKGNSFLANPNSGTGTPVYADATDLPELSYEQGVTRVIGFDPEGTLAVFVI